MNNPMKKKILSYILEIILISFASLLIALVGNTLSPAGIPLFPDLKEENELRKHFPEISPREVLKLIDTDIIILDARSEKYFEKSHLPSAINIPYKEAEKYYDKVLDYLPKDSLLIVYCNSENCTLSLRLAKKLKEWDFTQIRVLKGGFSEWTRLKYKTEQGK